MSTPYSNVYILGQGNVAQFLLNNLPAHHLSSRHPELLPADADLCIIAVSDDAISEVVKRLPATQATIVHTSGTVDINVLSLESHNYGIIYPLQTIKKGVDILPEDVPFLIEGNTQEVTWKLKEYLSPVFPSITECDSATRRKLHLAAVVANNFTNALLKAALEIAPHPRLLNPIIKQTFINAVTMGPENCQTGPAMREDLKTMTTHLEMLEGPLKEAYQAVSNLIMANKNSKTLT